ncbi:hypothetical protein [Natrarchaeobaculum sulfurireducens]|uniref:Rubredoxin family protein n=1 Tax=Natrarchaeobaculum sulfurireducens TaxID=2044521 RepID=A0A346PKQ9_9EURY|nr:Rubredoxin family protein [Natrarchaeobaculum sulfurireducens]AXR80104.1 Rubredoxin family protein [Natrarchaeobaculum sulfurireducens]
MNVEYVRSGYEFGEAHLIWQCLERGEMGDLTRNCWRHVRRLGPNERTATIVVVETIYSSFALGRPTSAVLAAESRARVQ